MNLAYISHHDCQGHQMGAHHVEVPERLHAINDRMIASGIEMLVTHYDAPMATREHLLRVHDADYVDSIFDAAPTAADVLTWVDGDTAMCSGTLNAAMAAGPRYQENFNRIADHISSLFGIKALADVGNFASSLLKQINIGSLIRNVANVVTSIAGNLGVIVIYVAFLLIEQQHFHKKLDALFPDPAKRRKVHDSCTLCGDCLQTCGALELRYGPLGDLASRRLLAVLVAALHAVFLGVARI